MNARVPRPDTAVPTGARTFRFGAFSLLPEARLLITADRPVKLGGRAFDVLVALVQRCERTVSKHELMDLVWPNRVVEENNLEVQMVALRKLLGHHAVATVSRCGYRFALSVQADGGTAIDDDVAALVVQITEAEAVDEALRLRLVAAGRAAAIPGWTTGSTPPTPSDRALPRFLSHGLRTMPARLTIMRTIHFS